jgi:hypothetical protein
MKNLVYTVVLVAFGFGQHLSAQTDNLLKQIPKNADFVLRLSPSALAEMGQQTWSLAIAEQLKTDILGKADAAFLRDILFLGLDSVGIGSGDSYWIGERTSDGISHYTYLLPMASMSKWLAYVQKTMSLYNNSDIRMAANGMIYVSREQTVIGWTREYLRITTFILPNSSQYAPTYVQQKTYLAEQLLPNFALPLSASLATDSSWARHCTPNSLLAFRLQHKEKVAYGQLTTEKNSLLLDWLQPQTHALQSWANWLKLNRFSLDLQKAAALANLAPNREPYPKIITTLQSLPLLKIAIKSPEITRFSLPITWAQLLKNWPK